MVLTFILQSRSPSESLVYPGGYIEGEDALSVFLSYLARSKSKAVDTVVEHVKLIWDALPLRQCQCRFCGRNVIKGQRIRVGIIIDAAIKD